MVARYTTLLNLPRGTGRWVGAALFVLQRKLRLREVKLLAQGQNVSSRARISPFLTTCLAPVFRVLTWSLQGEEASSPPPWLDPLCELRAWSPMLLCSLPLSLGLIAPLL